MSRAKTEKRFGVSIAAIVRNEAPYIAEWIEYHGLVGIEHFYIYDNGSTDDLAEVLRPYLLDGRATLIAWPDFPGQISAYNHALKIFGRDSEWMALLDIDEFIRVDGGRRLAAALAEFASEADQILLPWLQFGSSGHDAKPDALVIEAYVHRQQTPHKQPKSIVRPQAIRWAGVHHCETLSGRTVNGAGERVAEQWILDRPADGPIRVHHYFTKSRAEFVGKIARGQVDGGQGKGLADFHRFVTDFHDDGLAGMGAAVRSALERTASRSRDFSVAAPFSAQSELSPSRAWELALNKALRSIVLPAAPSVRAIPTMDCVTIVGALPEDAEKGLIEHVAAALDAAEICSFSEPNVDYEPADGRSPAQFGKPYTTCGVTSDRPVEAVFRVEGVDGGGKRWAFDYPTRLPEGRLFLCFIQSPRTMRIDRMRCDIADPDAAVTLDGKVFSFL